MTQETMICPCTTFQQDEDCVEGYPSLLCSACEGKGIAPVQTVIALAAEMMKIAEQVDELEDPFAAWETIEILKSKANNRLTTAAPALLLSLQELLEAHSKPDERLCCDGRECGCMGATVHQQAEYYARAAISQATP